MFAKHYIQQLSSYYSFINLFVYFTIVIIIIIIIIITFLFFIYYIYIYFFLGGGGGGLKRERKVKLPFIVFASGNRYLVSQRGVHPVLSNDSIHLSSLGLWIGIVLQTRS